LFFRSNLREKRVRTATGASSTVLLDFTFRLSYIEYSTPFPDMMVKKCHDEYISVPHQSKCSIEKVSIYILPGVAKPVAKPEINGISRVLIREGHA
jgi:hypothetical protein